MRIAETFDISKILQLAVKLKDQTDNADAAMLAAGTLELEAAYSKLKNEYMMVVAQNVSLKHTKMLTRLEENDTIKPGCLEKLIAFFNK